MHRSRIVAVATFAATLLLATAAGAENPRLVALRGAITELNARERSVRSFADLSAPRLRAESERIVARVDKQRTSVATRLDVLELLGQTDAVDDTSLRQMEATYTAADRLLAIVEGWYSLR